MESLRRERYSVVGQLDFSLISLCNQHVFNSKFPLINTIIICSSPCNYRPDTVFALVPHDWATICCTFIIKQQLLFTFGRHCCKVPCIIIPRPSGKEQGKVTLTPNSGRCHHNCLSLWFHSAALRFLPHLNSLGSKTEKCSETAVGWAVLLFLL